LPPRGPSPQFSYGAVLVWRGDRPIFHGRRSNSSAGILGPGFTRAPRSRARRFSAEFSSGFLGIGLGEGLVASIWCRSLSIAWPIGACVFFDRLSHNSGARRSSHLEVLAAGLQLVGILPGPGRLHHLTCQQPVRFWPAGVSCSTPVGTGAPIPGHSGWSALCMRFCRALVGRGAVLPAPGRVAGQARGHGGAGGLLVCRGTTNRFGRMLEREPPARGIRGPNPRPTAAPPWSAAERSAPGHRGSRRGHGRPRMGWAVARRAAARRDRGRILDAHRPGCGPDAWRGLEAAADRTYLITPFAIEGGFWADACPRQARPHSSRSRSATAELSLRIWFRGRTVRPAAAAARSR